MQVDALLDCCSVSVSVAPGTEKGSRRSHDAEGHLLHGAGSVVGAHLRSRGAWTARVV